MLAVMIAARLLITFRQLLSTWTHAVVVRSINRSEWVQIFWKENLIVTYLQDVPKLKRLLQKNISSCVPFFSFVFKESL
jgi:hypothetical protein